MNSKLYVRMTFVEGALIRLLGLAGRRGFGIAAVHARGQEGGLYEIMLELIGTRSIETLQRQIQKLYDVDVVEVIPNAQAAALKFDARPATFVQHMAV
jgi:acetolactate synthase regulatory subunit